MSKLKTFLVIYKINKDEFSFTIRGIDKEEVIQFCRENICAKYFDVKEVKVVVR